jgi:hypothetical protein
MVLVLDNLAGHLSYESFEWFFVHGVMPLYTPIGGLWLNMAESVQRIIVPRALAGQHPQNAQQIIDWLEQTMAVGTRSPRPLPGMASAGGDANTHEYAAWLDLVRPWSEGIQLWVDPLDPQKKTSGPLHFSIYTPPALPKWRKIIPILLHACSSSLGVRPPSPLLC